MKTLNYLLFESAASAAAAQRACRFRRSMVWSMNSPSDEMKCGSRNAARILATWSSKSESLVGVGARRKFSVVQSSHAICLLRWAGGGGGGGGGGAGSSPITALSNLLRTSGSRRPSGVKMCATTSSLPSGDRAVITIRKSSSLPKLRPSWKKRRLPRSARRFSVKLPLPSSSGSSDSKSVRTTSFQVARRRMMLSVSSPGA